MLRAPWILNTIPMLSQHRARMGMTPKAPDPALAQCCRGMLLACNPKKIKFMATYRMSSVQPFNVNSGYEGSKTDGDHLQAALIQIQLLASAPTNARSFLIIDVYGRVMHTSPGEAYKQTIFDESHACGYTSTFACIVDCTIEAYTTVGVCDDPAHYFYYIPE
ncbi:hypothetical protein A0H81_02963 [Grifola frondosa]|uniref:Uncharacterized protein n=1 Tax=Grifola frondosa TaxID=5627 RepID=A0A1C7MPB1_GRIFR|nr:hypothetical protein A0H81_02963 [Grifola frondosa]